MKKYIKLMRPHHYMKNLLVFAALVCSGRFFELGKFLAGCAGFAAFCMVSSAVYIVNDIQDVEKDKLHPTKCRRPLPAGLVSLRGAQILAVLLVVMAAICNGLVFQSLSTVLLVSYLILNLAYSFGLKNIAILDVTILMTGFLLRMFYGAIVTGIEVSGWLYMTAIAASFFFALGKRRNELKHLKNGSTRKVLEAYPISFLERSMNMCLTLAIVFYALWSTDERNIAAHGKYLSWTVPIVLLIVLKYSLNIEGESDGDPVEVLLHDKVLLALCTVYFAVMFVILYI